MAALLFAFLAGVLTTAAPCILPLLPVIVGGTIISPQSGSKDYKGPLLITLGLAVSIILFTLLLKASTSLLGVPQQFWQVLSGGIVLLFGLTLIFPELWTKLNLSQKADGLLHEASETKGAWGQFLMGAALGPVFNSCSPTYGLIVAVILPASFAQGFTYLLAYTLGLSLTLLMIGYLGRGVAMKLKVLANPTGAVRRVIGAIFILVGVLVLTGGDKAFQTYVLERGWYDSIAELEVPLPR